MSSKVSNKRTNSTWMKKKDLVIGETYCGIWPGTRIIAVLRAFDQEGNTIFEPLESTIDFKYYTKKSELVDPTHKEGYFGIYMDVALECFKKYTEQFK